VALNLRAPKRKVESFMTETCDVYAPDAVHKLAVDPVTYQMVDTPPATLRILNNVRCKIKDQTSVSRGAPVDSEGGNQLLVVVTKIDFSLDDVPVLGLPEGALIVCTSALRMQQLVGAQYLMRQPILKTFGIQYSVLADRRKPVDP
jgi:hypothetical protein